MTTLSLPIRRPRFIKVRRAAAKAWRGRHRTGAAVRARYRTPVLTISGLAFMDAAFWQISTFAGLLFAGIACWAYELFGDEK
jgi:hypothetical protein